MSHKLCKLNIHRLLALFLAVTLVFACAPAAYAAEGSCGDNLAWSFDGSTLTISGSGAIDDYSETSPAPWHGSREAILQVSLPEGLTRIGSRAFSDCVNLASVTLPSTVSAVADAAFYGCTGITMLSLNNGLCTIGDSAFSQCEALSDLRLPGTLISIGHHAFYMCKGLTYVTVPGSVSSIGSGVFSYCDSLIRVDVNAAVTLPSWSFYGCDNLQVVTIQGSSVSPESLKIPTPPTGTPQQTQSAVGQTQPVIQQPAVPAATQPPASTEPPAPAPEAGQANSEQLTTDNSGNLSLDTTTVQKTDNATTSTTTTTGGQDSAQAPQTQITSTIVNPQGWQEVIAEVNSALLRAEDTVDVTVYSQDSNQIDKETLQELSGKNVSLTVQTQSGSKFTLDCTKLPEKVKKDLELSYRLTLLEEVPEGMEGCTVYQLTFEKSADIQAEMVMRLPGSHSFQTATLYRLDKKEPVQLQSVMVDDSGNAHWYLRSIDHKQDYLIGINIPNAIEDSPIIPAELAGVYKVANVYDGVEYVVTGRTSSWNMGLGQVMGILAVVMVSAIVIIGFAMYALNKRRLKNGYVPQWLDEDEE